MGKWAWLGLLLACGLGLGWAGEPRPPVEPPGGPPVEPPGEESGRPPEPGRPPHGMPGVPADMMRRLAEFGGIPPGLIQFWRETDPDFLAELRDLGTARPEEAREVIPRALGEMRELQELKMRDPEAFDLHLQRRKLDRQVHKLGLRLRTVKANTEKEAGLAELRSTLDRLFEVVTSLRDREASALEERLRALRDQNKRWRDNKADVIDRRVKELTGELDYLKW